MAGQDVRRRVVSVMRTYDYLAVAGALAAAILLSQKAACAPRAILAPVLVAAGCAIAIVVWRPRFGYGTPPDLVGLALCVAAAGASHILAGGASACAYAAQWQWLWLGLLALLGAPRVAVAALRLRSGASRVEEKRPGYRMGRMHRGRTAWIICLSAAVDEPRARRQADALHQGGWNVVVFGYPGRAEPPAYWTLVELPQPSAPRPGSALAEFFRPYAAQAALLGARFSPRLANRYYWMNPAHDQAFGAIARIAAERELPCDLICHHDYFTAPLAHRLAAAKRLPVSADIHEYARGQFMDRFVFRTVTTHYVHALQKICYPRTELLTVVCQGIADLLEEEYPLRRKPLVIRNVSFYEAMPFRQPGERISVLYHGLVNEKRGLEEAIDSLPLWRPEFDLVIRGPGRAAYLGALRERAARRGVGARVRFEPAVPLTDLIRAANRCDIGFFASPSYSPQKRFTAPNKLFEYIMAGLALCVSDLPEMRRVLVQGDVGRMFAGLEPQSIAQAINGFSRDSIAEYKRRSLAFARELCWEHERTQLIAAYDGIHAAATAA